MEIDQGTAAAATTRLTKRYSIGKSTLRCQAGSLALHHHHGEGETVAYEPRLKPPVGHELRLGPLGLPAYLW
jgi:hypothetical protein